MIAASCRMPCPSALFVAVSAGSLDVGDESCMAPTAEVESGLCGCDGKSRLGVREPPPDCRVTR